MVHSSFGKPPSRFHSSFICLRCVFFVLPGSHFTCNPSLTETLTENLLKTGSKVSWERLSGWSSMIFVHLSAQMISSRRAKINRQGLQFPWQTSSCHSTPRFRVNDLDLDGCDTARAADRVICKSVIYTLSGTFQLNMVCFFCQTPMCSQISVNNYWK